MNIYRKDEIPKHLLKYFEPAEIGLEETPPQFIAKLVAVFAECRRVLHASGTLWLNMGDSYCTGPKNRTHDFTKSTLQGGLSTQANSMRQPTKIYDGWKQKDMMGMPWRLAFALQDDGWYLRSDVIWHKTNGLPESVTDRPSKAHEYVFMLTKGKRYFYDQDAERPKLKPSSVARLAQDVEKQKGSDRQPGKKNGSMKAVGSSDGANVRTVWSIPVGRFKRAHFAVFPKRLVQPCVRLGTSSKGCCPTCLSPWVRVVRKIRRPTRPGTESKVGLNNSNIVGNRDPQRHCTERIPIGWKQNCECEAAEPVPCLVFDPFVGSGTTMSVAVEEGRRALGVELNPKYCKFIDRRMEATQPHLFGRV